MKFLSSFLTTTLFLAFAAIVCFPSASSAWLFGGEGVEEYFPAAIRVHQAAVVEIVFHVYGPSAPIAERYEDMTLHCSDKAGDHIVLPQATALPENFKNADDHAKAHHEDNHWAAYIFTVSSFLADSPGELRCHIDMPSDKKAQKATPDKVIKIIPADK